MICNLWKGIGEQHSDHHRDSVEVCQRTLAKYRNEIHELDRRSDEESESDVYFC